MSIDFPDQNLRLRYYGIGSCAGPGWYPNTNLSNEVFLRRLNGQNHLVSRGQATIFNTNVVDDYKAYKIGAVSYPTDWYIVHRGSVPTAEDAQVIADGGNGNSWRLCPCAACQNPDFTAEEDLTTIQRLIAIRTCDGPADTWNQLDLTIEPPIYKWHFTSEYVWETVTGWNIISGYEVYFEYWEYIVQPESDPRAIWGGPLVVLGALAGLAGVALSGASGAQAQAANAFGDRRRRRIPRKPSD